MSDKTVVEYDIGDGKTVFIEVEDESGGLRKASRDKPLKAEKTLDQALDNVLPSAERMLGRLQGLTLKPSGVELELGVKFNVKSGAVIASTALEGNIRIKLTWYPGGVVPPGGPAQPTAVS